MRNLHTGGPNVCIDGLQLVPWTAVFSWSHGQQSSAGPMDSSSGGLMDYQRKPWTLWTIKGSLEFYGLYSVENLVLKDALMCFGPSFILKMLDN